MSPIGDVEEWRPMVGREDKYMVSSHGRVVSYAKGKPRIKAQWLNSTGRWAMTLPGQRSAAVHRLVAAAFCPRQDGQDVVRHLDGNPLNNHASNLAWGTQWDNVQDMLRHGTHASKNQTHCVHGHEFTDENTMRQPNGSRHCRECHNTRHRIAKRARVAAKRAAREAAA